MALWASPRAAAARRPPGCTRMSTRSPSGHPPDVPPEAGAPAASAFDVTSAMLVAETNPGHKRTHALIGQTISGRYRIHELIAMGGMGAVYRGEHIHLRKRLAVKVLHPETENLPDLVERFRREALVGAHARHPHVAAATDFGTLDDGSYFLVLEHVKGVTLHDALRRGPLPPARVVHIVRQLAEALDALHARGIVHRDVKPQNVMLVNPAHEAAPSADATGTRSPDFVKLIDFGLAMVELERLPSLEFSISSLKAAAPALDRLTMSGMIFGTLAYLAPEATQGMMHVDGRADLYALGVTLYEMLTGRRPFLGEDIGELIAQHVSAIPPPFREAAPGLMLSPDLERITMRLLEKNPDDRFQRGSDLVAALDQAIASGKTVSTTPSTLHEEFPPYASPPTPAGPHAAFSPPMGDPSGLGLTPPAHQMPPGMYGAPPAPQPAPSPALPSPPAFAYWAALILPVLGAGAYVAFLRAKDPPPPAASLEDQAALEAPPSNAPPAPNPLADPAAPASSARQGGLNEDDLERLRAQVRLASSKSFDYEAGRKALMALTSLDPASLKRANLAGAAVEIVAGVEDRGRPGSHELFDLLASEHSAPYGLDLLYEVVLRRPKRKAAQHALELLRKPDIIARASPALRVTFALREADCPHKDALAARAAAEGDGRTLVMLKISLSGCKTPALEKAYGDLFAKLMKK
jgi:eukaryotic-like serine/threonine-protein kinase